MKPDAVLPNPVQSLTSASLLAICGGLLDAFVYLNHGHVFASAMTGNGVLLGIAAVDHNWWQVLRHLVPAISFLCGALASRLLQDTLGRISVQAGLLLEIVTLFWASWLPAGFPNLVFIATIAFVAAYQVSSFRTVDEFSYNSTFITGNLRTMADGLYEIFLPGRRVRGLRKFRDLSLIVLGFLAGAALGALLAPTWRNHTLWFAEPPLLAVLALSLRRQLRADHT